MKSIKHIILSIFALGCGVSTASAQLYEEIESRNIWNSSNNVTGLLRDSVVVSNAELFFNTKQGDFHSFSDGSSLWSAGAEAKNIAHRDNLSMIGEFAYSHTSIKDASGSMFIQPSAYPLDILEFTPGDKALQRYYFMGGLSTEILPRLSVGLKGVFTSQNYAKFKDVRHYSYRMDLSFAPSISYQIGEVTLGANYIYTRDSETIRAKEIGTTAEPYFAFLDKGLMFGAYQNWEGGGIHLTEAGVDGFPVTQTGHGVAVQADYRGFYADLAYNYNKGIIGEKQTFWFNYPSETLSATIAYTSIDRDKTQIFILKAKQEEIINNENVVDDETNNGVTTNVVYGCNQIFSSKRLSIEPEYRLLFNKGGFVELGAGYYLDNSQSTQMYPYVDELKLEHYNISARGMKPFGGLELRGALLLSSGGWSDDEYSVAADQEAGDNPFQLTEYYNMENEFVTATYVDASLSLRYNIALGFYGELGAQYIKAFDVKYIGGSRWGATFKVGYNF